MLTRFMRLARKPISLWSRFAQWRDFRSQYLLVRVAGSMYIGHSQLDCHWWNGSPMLWDLSGRASATVSRQTQLGLLTLRRYYVLREQLTGNSVLKSSTEI